MEEKGVNNFQCMDSLEERVSVFFDEFYSDELSDDRCLEYDDDDDESHDPEERTLFWESQYSILQVFLTFYNIVFS